jgi:hypothetical protein
MNNLLLNNLFNKGFQVFEDAIDLNLINDVIQGLENSYSVAREIQKKNGIDILTDGTIHHLLAHSDSVYLDLIEYICKSEYFQYIESFFKGNFILNSYGGLKNLPSNPSYVTNIHRDIRFFSGNFPLMLNLLIMLDDFTIENGATYLLPGSHLKSDKPNDFDFYEKAERATGKRGDILFFDSNLWHAAGINSTTDDRRAITITFTKPFMKQQLDYPRVIGYEKIEEMSDNLKQILGFFSRTPSNLDEWYQKPEFRFYRPGQD